MSHDESPKVTEHKPQPVSTGHFVTHLFAGAIAGLVADGVVHPIDTCRARLQVQKGASNLLYKNTLDTFWKIFRDEGWRALYKGFVVVAGFTVPAHALYFWGYETCKKTLRPSVPMEEKGPIVHFVSGVFADIMGSIAWVPQDVIKQRLQVQKTITKKAGSEGTVAFVKYKGSLHCMRTIIAEEGFRALWTGYSAALAVYCPFVGIYFVVYEQSKLLFKRLLGLRSVNDLSMPYQLVGGAVAGAAAAAITSPLDVIKTRIQVGDKYKGWIDGVKRVLQEEGPSAFAKGIGARVLWIAPGTAITIASYEQIKLALTYMFFSK